LLQALQLAELTAADGAAGDNFGISVALSGATAVVGAYTRNNGAGAVYVFVYTGTTWTQQAELTASDGAAGDNFGSAVAVQYNTIAVGAYGRHSSTGAVYVFVRNGSTWTQQATVTAPYGLAGDKFGISVALQGSSLLAGASGWFAGTGAAYVFVRGLAGWSLQAKWTGPTSGAGFGISVTLNGANALVGADFAGTDYYFNGAAYVFARNNNTWTAPTALLASDGLTQDQFGYAVALSGTTAIVGAPSKNNGTGAAYVFVNSGGSWTQQTELVAPDGAPQDHFGDAVAVRGPVALIAAATKNNATGAVYAYVRTQISLWNLKGELVAPDGAPGERFGAAVTFEGLARGGIAALIGGPGKNSARGVAYILIQR
jgi:hypothetical protein